MLRLALLSSVLVAFGPQISPPAPRLLPAPSFEAAVSDLRFTLEPRDDRQVQFGLSYAVRRNGRADARGNTSRPQSWAALEGLDRAAVAGPAGRLVDFRLDREAGDLHCSGATTGGGAGGSCRFEADRSFAEALRARTGEAPGEGALFHLAMSGFSLDTLSELDRQGYDRPRLDEIVAAAIHGVDAPYVSAIAGSGYRLKSLEGLTAFRIHDVTPEYITALAALGPSFRDLPAGDVMALSLHDVTPDYVRELAALGIAPDEAGDLVGLRIHGVTPEGVRALAAAGYGGLSVEQHMAFAIHGVTPEFIRSMAEAGRRDLGADQLVSLRIHGGAPRHGRVTSRQPLTAPHAD